jgi:pyruvate/2-oxoacid:ferredoxin oxidoreductase alpha subunit
MSFTLMLRKAILPVYFTRTNSRCIDQARADGCVIVQDAHNLAVAAHEIAHRASIPVIHFYDGPSTGFARASINVLEAQELLRLSDSRPSTVQKPSLLDVRDLVLEAFQCVQNVLGAAYAYAFHTRSLL